MQRFGLLLADALESAKNTSGLQDKCEKALSTHHKLQKNKNMAL